MPKIFDELLINSEELQVEQCLPMPINARQCSAMLSNTQQFSALLSNVQPIALKGFTQNHTAQVLG